MNKKYVLFFIIISHSCILCSEEEIFYENQVASLKVEVIELQEQRNNLLITLKKEMIKKLKGKIVES